MRKLPPLSLIKKLSNGKGGKDIMKANREIEGGVMATLNKFAEAYEQRDMKGVLSFLVPDTDVVVIGTGADEKRIGLDEIKLQLERDWSQTDVVSMEISRHLISAAGNVAWITADIVFRARAGRQEIKLPSRLTAVLEQRGKRWLIAQWHVSVPAAGQKEGESFPAK